jgi:hypothetical protein
MRFWTTDWSYNDFFNRLKNSANFAFTEFSEVISRILHRSSFQGREERL